MCDFAMQQEDVKLLAANERLAEAEADFVDAGDGDWKKRLKYQPRTSLLENSVYNLNLILANDPDFRNFAFNDMANRMSRACTVGRRKASTSGTTDGRSLPSGSSTSPRKTATILP